MGKYLDDAGLTHFWSLLKSSFMSKGRKYILFQQDFMTNVVAAWPPFTGASISSGTAQVTTGTAHHIGCITLKSSSTANSGYQFNLGIASLLLAGGESFEFIFKTPALIRTTTSMRLGFQDSSTTAVVTDGVFFNFAAGVITGKTSLNKAVTTSVGSFTPKVSTWYRAKITVESTSSALFEIFADDSDTTVFSERLTTNIPTETGRETGVGVIATESGTTSTEMIVLDYVCLEITRTLQR